MKTQTTGMSPIVVDCSECRKPWTRPVHVTACASYRLNRENGLRVDMPPVDFPRDGEFKWEIPGVAQSRIQYIEGPLDRQWMEECDRNYVFRLEHEGRLDEEEPNLRTEVPKLYEEVMAYRATRATEGKVRMEAEMRKAEEEKQVEKKAETERIINITESRLQAALQVQEKKFRGLLDGQRVEQEIIQQTLLQQLQTQQEQIVKQLQDQQKQFKAQQDQLKSQFEVLTTELHSVQQSLKEELNVQQAQKFEQVFNKATELTTHFTHELDQLRFFKSDNPSIWRTIIANKDYDHLALLIERKVSPKGMSFISVSEDKTFQEHHALLREKGAIFTPEELLQDLDEVLLKCEKGMIDKKHLKNLREDIVELLDLIIKGALPENMQKTYNKTTVQTLLLDVKTLKIPEALQKILIEKIKLLQAQKSQAWLSNKLEPELAHQLDQLIIHQFWEQLKLTEEKENSNYPFIRENVALCFADRYRENNFPESFQEKITNLLTENFLERYKKRDIEKPLSAAIAEAVNHFYDEVSEKVFQMDLYYQKAIREVIQKWRSNELTSEAIVAIDQAVLKIENVVKMSEEIRQQLDEAGIARLLDQIKNNNIDDPLMKLFFENQIQNIISCLKTEEESEQALSLIIEDWHNRKLDQALDEYFEARTTKLWQDKLEQIHLALNPWLKVSQVKTMNIPQPKPV